MVIAIPQMTIIPQNDNYQSVISQDSLILGKEDKWKELGREQ